MSPSECYFIGDDPDLDILPPKKLGMKTILIGEGCKDADYTAKSLAEAGKIIEGS